MAGYFVVGVLAAIGLLCVLWALLGWLLPSGKGCVLVCYGMPDPGICSRYRWLHGMGLLSSPLMAVDVQDPPYIEDIEFCAGERLLSRLKQERNQEDGTGTGDSPGRDQRRGVSEL